MFGRVKKWLGIEGVKIEIDIPAEIPRNTDVITGQLRFLSMHDQTITAIRLKLIERFSRGRRRNRMTDEYELGYIQMEDEIFIPAHDVIEIDFELPFERLLSDIDRFGEKNIVTGGLATVARFIRGAKSTYRLEAEADVKGVKFNPITKQPVLFV